MRVNGPAVRAAERFLAALQLQGLRSVRSDLLLMEQLQYNLLFWVVCVPRLHDGDFA